LRFLIVFGAYYKDQRWISGDFLKRKHQRNKNNGSNEQNTRGEAGVLELSRLSKAAKMWDTEPPAAPGNINVEITIGNFSVRTGKYQRLKTAPRGWCTLHI
jgi:hypothetical protein